MRIVKTTLKITIVQACASLLALVLLSAPCAKADLTPSLMSGPVIDGSNFDFNYEVSESDLARLDPTATSGVTCPGPGKLVQCIPKGSFFTIYDIQGFVSANTLASGWSVSAQFTGLTPSSINGSSIDDPTLVNVTFSYTGPVIIGPFSVTEFQIISTDSGVTTGTFSFQDTNNSLGLANGTTLQGVGSLDVPLGRSDGTSVSEPGSFLLLSSGLAGLVGFARKKQSIV